MQYIQVKGRHSNRLTTCYACHLGHSEEGASHCSLCPENEFYSADGQGFGCKKCPRGYYSYKGSVGEVSCKQRRPCDEGDLVYAEGVKCNNGKRQVTYKWFDVNGDGHPECDPDHEESSVKKLPKSHEEECKKCTQGMSRDANGNCRYCAIG